jgi:hypothetical protein
MLGDQVSNENVVKIKNWYVNAGIYSPYTPPECRGNPALSGEVEWHPVLGAPPENDKVITTSPISQVRGLTVKTRNTTYRLVGKPHQRFFDFLQSKDLPYIPSSPLFPLIENGYIHVVNPTPLFPNG